MSISTIYKFIIVSLLFCAFVTLDTQAQGFNINARCEYTAPCFFVAYESIEENDTDPATLTVVLSVIPTEECNRVQNFLFTTTAGLPVTRTVNQLRNDPFVSLIVNRDEFTTNPNVQITTSFPRVFTLPFFGPITIPTISGIINLDADLDSNEPCVQLIPLPVELVHFRGKTAGSSILLEWRTASEQNNEVFEVERSSDGFAFQKIGTVAGKGNSSVTIEYSYTDSNPLAGTNYYRLKQIDFDGKYEHSPVITVEARTAHTAALAVEMAPNPCHNGDCIVRISNRKEGTQAMLRLKDMTGRIVYSTALQGQEINLELPRGELAKYKGMFILEATSGSEVVHRRVVLE